MIFKSIDFVRFFHLEHFFLELLRVNIVIKGLKFRVKFGFDKRGKSGIFQNTFRYIRDDSLLISPDDDIGDLLARDIELFANDRLCEIFIVFSDNRKFGVRRIFRRNAFRI